MLDPNFAIACVALAVVALAIHRLPPRSSGCDCDLCEGDLIEVECRVCGHRDEAIKPLGQEFSRGECERCGCMEMIPAAR